MSWPVRKAPTVYEQAWGYYIVSVGTVYQNAHDHRLLTGHKEMGQLVSGHRVITDILDNRGG